MAALSKDAPTKSFFSGPSFKKLVNVFPKPQKHSLHTPQLPQPSSRHEQQQRQPKLAFEPEVEEPDEDEIDVVELVGDDVYEGETTSSAAEDPGVDVGNGVDGDNGLDGETEYSNSSDGEYSRPRIHQDLLPHDFSAWQKSPSIASSTSREAETFSEVLSSSTSQDRYAPEGGGVSCIWNSQFNECREHFFNPNYVNGHSNTSPSERYRNPSPTISAAMASSPLADLHLQKVRQKLPDLKLDVVANGGSCKYSGPAGLKALPEECWSVWNGASEEGRVGRRNSVDGSCWQRRHVHDPVATSSRVRELMQEGNALHQNLVDVTSFKDSYKEHQEAGYHRNNFQHHASMVYTRAPSREATIKKVADTANARRVSKNPRRLKKKSEPMWEEEQENQPRRARGPNASCSPRRVSYENAVDIAKLQDQVEELKRKLSTTVQSYHCMLEPKNDIQILEEKVQDLQSKIAEKDLLLGSAQETLTLKEDEIQAMQKHLRDSEEICAGLRARNANTEEEVTALRCEVAALRWQIELDAERARSEIITSTDKEAHDHTATKDQEEEWAVGKVEAVRKTYLAAIIVAKLVPREECLTLVRILRAQLQFIVRI